jgi:diguanylate cyclase (GGDEF)-like protein
LDRSRLVNPDEHYRYLALIAAHQDLEIALNEIILRARHAYLTSYDPLVKVINRLHDNLAELHHPPRFLNGAERAALTQALAHYQTLLTQRETLSERFKSDNAILHNSLSFFSVAASEMADDLQETAPQQAAMLQELLRDILMYNLYSYANAPRRIDDMIETLKTAHLTSNSVDPSDWQRSLRHAETIIRHKKQLDEITVANLDLPTRAALQTLQHTYHSAYLRAMDSTNRYRLVLYLLTIALAAGMAYATIHRYNAELALRQSNEQLEQKVKQRTEALQQSNQSLQAQKAQIDESLTELQKAQTELQRLAMTDELTNLYARRFVFAWLKQQLAKTLRDRKQLSVLMLDIDFFKKINDTFGHVQGDTVLKNVAQTLKHNSRQADIVGRLGGEEFIVLLPDTIQANAVRVAEKIRQAVATINTPTPVTISVGVATCDCTNPRDNNASIDGLIDALLQSADQALYQAKDQGRNRVCVNHQSAL